MRHALRLAVVMVVVFSVAGVPSVGAAELPQTHAYQRVLRAHLATYTEADFAHGVTEPMTQPPGPEDPAAQFRHYLLTLMHQPLVGSKRGAPSVNAPARLFTLKAIEGSEEGVLLPPIWPESLMGFVEWDYAGNPYHNNRGLKLRAFVNACIMMMMTDDFLDHEPDRGRSDQFAYQLVYWGKPYLGMRDMLPAEVREAFATGMRRMAERVMAWGPHGADVSQDMIAPVGLWYARQAVDDADFRAKVDERIGWYFSDPSILHPAGYWVEHGGLDLGFAGMANVFAGWAALATGRDDVREAVERVYRLRAHLILRDHDGRQVSPTHFHTRIGMPAHEDQWAWGGVRDWAAAMVTDEAAHLVRTPTPEQFAEAAAKRSRDFAEQMRENPVHMEKTREAGGYVYYENEELESRPWFHSTIYQRPDRAGGWRMWMTWNFPVSVNYAYEFAPPDAWAHRQALERSNSPMLKSPFERGGHFVRDFEQAFVVASQPGYRAIVHTGPVGAGEERSEAGYGGGQLSAFATDAAGVVLLGRRSGVGREPLDAWRSWPLHAVTGVTDRGAVFTSARIPQPAVDVDVRDTGGRTQVTGLIPKRSFGQELGLEGQLSYWRAFTLDRQGVRVTTRLRGDGGDRIAELYETLPVFHRTDHRQAEPETAIAFEVGGQWRSATAEATANVTAVRLTRFDGAVEVRFDRPRRVMLSPETWEDQHLSRAVVRTVLVDLLESNAGPATIDDEVAVSYVIRPVGS